VGDRLCPVLLIESGSPQTVVKELEVKQALHGYTETLQRFVGGTVPKTKGKKEPQVLWSIQ
jgi:hypothetical protein